MIYVPLETLIGASNPILCVSFTALQKMYKDKTQNIKGKACGTHNVNESRDKDQEDCKNPHQGAVESGLNNPFRQSLQRNGEKLQIERNTY